MWFIYLSIGVFAFPLLAARWRQRDLDRPMLFIAAWYALLLIENATAYFVRELSVSGNNLDVAKYYMPFEAALVLAALAEWQVQPLARTTVRLCIPLYMALWVVAMWLVERKDDFTYLAGPILGLLVLVAALFAFVSRIQDDDRPVLRTTWGWILPGLAIFFAINVTATLLSAILYEQEQFEVMKQVSYMQSLIYIIATLMVTWGFLWPTRLLPSGASSSPSPSR